MPNQSLKILAIAALYVLTAKLGLLLAIPPGVATVVWPPSGIALAGVLGWGWRMWPGIWLGSFVVNVGTVYDPSAAAASVAIMAAIATGSTLQALVGAFAVRRVLGTIHPFDRAKDVAMFVGLATAGALIASTIGTTSLAVGERIMWSAYPATWLTWWMGDTLGILLLAPLALTWKREIHVLREPQRLVEALLLMTLIGIVGLIALGPVSLVGLAPYPPFPLIPLIMWAAFRFGHTGVAIAMLLVSGIAIEGVIDHVGPFIQPTLTASLLMAQAFVGVIGTTGFVLTAALNERTQAERERQRLTMEIQKAAKLESLGMLAAGIAHDFNNLLTAVVGNLYLVKRSLDPAAEEGRRLAEAEHICLRAQTLTKQLLTFAKGGTPVKETVSLGDLLVRWVGFALGGSNIRADYAIQPDLSPVDADEGQLSQVINNLVMNAKDVMPQGGHLAIRADNVTLRSDGPLPLPAGRYVQVAVHDQGPGIPAADLPKIFDPFFTTKPRGTGLGLTTSYAIVKKHDGYLAAESTPGQGSTFLMYLPASRRTITRPSTAVARPATAGAKILFMDDEPPIRDFVGALLQQAGCDAVCVGDGGKAVEQYQTALRQGRPFDVVILDLTVPGAMGGQETIKRLLEIDPRAAAIVSSGYSNDPVVAEFGAHGFIGRLTKPYDPDDLMRLVSEIMRKKTESVRA
ncbi:MAG: MASE1 domain-containing protein [Nitrospiria bacterium]